MQLRALLFLVFSVFVMLGCNTKTPELSLADIRVPDPERDLRRELGVERIVEISRDCHYWMRGDTMSAVRYDSIGRLVQADSYYNLWHGRNKGFYTSGYWLDSTISIVCMLNIERYDYELYSHRHKLLMRRGVEYPEPDSIWYLYNTNGQVQKEKQKFTERIFHCDNEGRLMLETFWVQPDAYFWGGSDSLYERGVVATTRFYYRENGSFLDSVVKSEFDLDGMNVHNGSTKYFNDQGLPTYTAYERGDTTWYQVELFE